MNRSRTAALSATNRMLAATRRTDRSRSSEAPTSSDIVISTMGVISGATSIAPMTTPGLPSTEM